MSNELITIEAPEELKQVATASGLDKANQHALTFAPFMIKCNELSTKLTSINKDNPGTVDVRIARDVRLALVKNRTASDKVREQSKATLLAEGNLIQGLYNVIKSKSILLEADFEAIEKAAEIKEAARKAALKEERTGRLAEFNLDLTAYNLAEMSEDTFNDLLTSQKLLKQERETEAARVEAERIEREKKEAEERERMRLENERLKKEAEEREAAIAAERKKIEEQQAEERRLAKIETDRIAKENADKLAAIEKANAEAREKARKEQEAKDKEAARILAEQKAAAAKLAAELKAKKDAEDKLQREKEEAEKQAKIAADKAAKAPVKEKLKVWVAAVDMPVPPDAMGNEIYEKFQSFKKWAVAQIDNL